MLIYWFKRDLRLADNAPLEAAARIARNSHTPLLLLYLVEPWLLADKHQGEHHWRFIWQSLQQLEHQLTRVTNTQPPVAGYVQVAWGNAPEVLRALHHRHTLQGIYSHQETGLHQSYRRDQQIQRWTTEQGVPWYEWPANGVQRGRGNRRGWQQNWYRTMAQNVVQPAFHDIQWGALPAAWQKTAPPEWQRAHPQYQHGGELSAWKWLRNFFAERGKQYHRHLSKPLTARYHCSRLSPYLAFGNLSVRQVWQLTNNYRYETGWRAPMRAFRSRLRWHCHFIQKFEQESTMEWRPLNRGYEQFPFTGEASHLLAWQRGKTGYPLVDAGMRCLQQTGYVNFRLRAMLVSFLVHHLRLDWRWGAPHLGRLFLDFEPGIHYPQFQMQAAMTGIHTVRIYNPVKQAEEHDANGDFVRHWVPELSRVPAPEILRPWTMSCEQQPQVGCVIGKDYPAPIIDLAETGPAARELFWGWKKRPEVKADQARILTRHVDPASRERTTR